MPRTVELFAGGGGMALGTRRAGFEHEELVERDANACTILRVNGDLDPTLWKPDNVRQMDVRKWLLELPHLGLSNIDVVAGGPPCQPFSHGGEAAGHTDKRNMFPAAIEAVQALRPRLVMFENVPGLLRPGFKEYYDYLTAWLSKPDVVPRPDETWLEHAERIRGADEDDLTYRVYPEVVNAADLGLPQVRKRLFLVAIRSDVRGADTWPGITTTHSKDALLYSQMVTKAYQLEHDLARLSVPTSCARYRRRIKALAEPPTRLRWRTLRDELDDLPTPRPGRQVGSIANHVGIPNARTYHGHTGSAYDWPGKTLKAGVHGVCGGEAMIAFSNGKVRYLTVRESARIQGFHDAYLFPLKRTPSMRALGNAVAVDVAEAVARQLRARTGI